MSTLDWPDPIAAYFAADRLGPDAVARCFSTDAVVKDEGRSVTGRDAIRQWKAAAGTAYRYVSQPLAIQSTDVLHVVTSRVTGDFPGSPVDLRYHFRLAGGLITSLEIAP